MLLFREESGMDRESQITPFSCKVSSFPDLLLSLTNLMDEVTDKMVAFFYVPNPL